MKTSPVPMTLRASAGATEGNTAGAERIAMRTLLNEADRLGAHLDIPTLAVHVSDVRGVVGGERRVLVVATCAVA